MKKITIYLLMSLSSLYAETTSDIAITVGNNKFNDPVILKKKETVVGVRAGVYENNLGIQVGYEVINDANCQKLDLKRAYTNAVVQMNLNEDFAVYGLATLGYEMSNIHRYKPDQVVYGVGAGAKYKVISDVDAFVEIKQLKKVESKDTDVITGGGVSYTFNSGLEY